MRKDKIEDDWQHIEETEILISHCYMDKDPHKLDIYSDDQKRYTLNCESWMTRYDTFHKLKENMIIRFRNKDNKIIGDISYVSPIGEKI